MAKATSERSKKSQLIAEIDASRSALGEDLRSISASLDVPLRISRQLRSTPMKVAAGSAVAGLIGSLLLGGSGKKIRSAARHSGPMGVIIRYFMKLSREAKSTPTKPSGLDIVEIVRAVARLVK